MRKPPDKAKNKKSVRLFFNRNPWYNSYQCAKQRCTNPNNPRFKDYGGRGIKFILTIEDAAFLWDRDNAYALYQPSIDRINNDGDYEFSNCRWIEKGENSSRQHRRVVLTNPATLGTPGQRRAAA